MADIASALAAIEQRFSAAWTATPVAFPNGPAPAVLDGNQVLVPWVYFEVYPTDSDIRGVGKPGSHVVVDDGQIVARVFVPVNEDANRAIAFTHATAIGEIFRVKEFYQVEPGCCVRTWTPRVGRGEEATMENPDGNWWAVSVTIPFEFIRMA